jgi:hypothetical protein
MIEIHPKEIKGSWDQGYVLDVHTVAAGGRKQAAKFAASVA